MIISKDADNMIYLNNSVEEAESYTEIDIGGDGIEEFSFCDDMGQRYVAKEVKPKVFKLVEEGEPSIENLKEFMVDVNDFGAIPKEFSSVEELRKHLSI